MAHISGTDLIKDHTGEFYVLEDNWGSSGVAYMLENRNVMKKVVTGIIYKVSPVDDYTSQLINVYPMQVIQKIRKNSLF